MMPPYEGTDEPREGAPSRNATGLVPSDQPYRTTYRCLRMGCAMTVRLLNTVDRCPRCSALMAVIERPELDLEQFVATATADVVAGFTALLDAAADDRYDRTP
jgi:hypothetical protein